MPDRAALRPADGRRDDAPGDVPAGPRSRALAVRLRPALAPARRRPLRREPVPPGQAPPAPGRPEALARRRPGDLPAEPRAAGHRPGRARRPLRGGQLGVADARRLGRGLAGRDGRDGDLAVHVLPAGRAGSTSRRSPPRSRTASSGSRCSSRRSTRSTTSAGTSTLTYGQVRRRDEVELSKYAFEVADAELAAADAGSPRARGAAAASTPASCCRPTRRRCVCSHQFNVLDARGAVSATDRVGLIRRIRDLACACARAYVSGKEGQRSRLASRSRRRFEGARPAIRSARPAERLRRETQDFVLEIRTEEIPAPALAAGAAGARAPPERGAGRGGARAGLGRVLRDAAPARR